MPRITSRYRYKAPTDELRARTKRFRTTKGEWVDPFPNVLGTVPEKMVYAQLIWRRIPFQFQTWFRVQIPLAGFDDWYRPDFILPDRKIIIEIQGAYWHSQPEQVEKDAFKYALYQSLGYKVLTWWDYEIYNNLPLLFAQDASLGWTGGKRGGRIITEHQEIIDDAKGIRTTNTKRANYAQKTTRQKRGRYEATPLSRYSVSY